MAAWDEDLSMTCTSCQPWACAMRMHALQIEPRLRTASQHQFKTVTENARLECAGGQHSYTDSEREHSTHTSSAWSASNMLLVSSVDPSTPWQALDTR